MSNFKIGDRVVVTENSQSDGYQDLKGCRGIIREICPIDVCCYRVQLDNKQHSRHSDGYYRFHASEICLEKENEMNILDVYFENEQEKNDKNFEKMKEKTMRKDLVYKEVMDLKNKYKDVEGVEINISTRNYNPSDAVIKELHKLYNKRDARDKELRELEKEIKAQIELCETYEQKQKILKTYGVIDDQGKLIK